MSAPSGGIHAARHTASLCALRAAPPTFVCSAASVRLRLRLAAGGVCDWQRNERRAPPHVRGDGSAERHGSAGGVAPLPAAKPQRKQAAQPLRRRSRRGNSAPGRRFCFLRADRRSWRCRCRFSAGRPCRPCLVPCFASSVRLTRPCSAPCFAGTRRRKARPCSRCRCCCSAAEDPPCLAPRFAGARRWRARPCSRCRCCSHKAVRAWRLVSPAPAGGGPDRARVVAVAPTPPKSVRAWRLASPAPAGGGPDRARVVAVAPTPPKAVRAWRLASPAPACGRPDRASVVACAPTPPKAVRALRLASPAPARDDPPVLALSLVLRRRRDRPRLHFASPVHSGWNSRTGIPPTAMSPPSQGRRRSPPCFAGARQGGPARARVVACAPPPPRPSAFAPCFASPLRLDLADRNTPSRDESNKSRLTALVTLLRRRPAREDPPVLALSLVLRRRRERPRLHFASPLHSRWTSRTGIPPGRDESTKSRPTALCTLLRRRRQGRPGRVRVVACAPPPPRPSAFPPCFAGSLRLELADRTTSARDATPDSLPTRCQTVGCCWRWAPARCFWGNRLAAGPSVLALSRVPLRRRNRPHSRPTFAGGRHEPPVGFPRPGIPPVAMSPVCSGRQSRRPNRPSLVLLRRRKPSALGALLRRHPPGRPGHRRAATCPKP